MSVARDLLHDYQHIIESLTLVTGSKGVFDVRVDDELIFSKAEVGRHARNGEVLDAFRDRFGRDVEVFAR